MARDSASKSGADAPVAVAIEGDAKRLLPLGQKLAADLNLPLAAVAPWDRFGLLLVLTDKRLELRQTGRGRAGPVYADFLGGRIGRRRRNVIGGERMLAKAVGFKGKPLSVVDATAGLGRDAFLLACMGCTVTAIERSPVVAALLQDGLGRAAADPALARIIEQRLHLVPGDARRLLARLPAEERPEVVYLDPMFPSGRKSAAVKKEMRLCRLVAGDDPDADELFEVARTVARTRVVVKRPLRAPHLGGKPAIVYKGTTIRYDVYLTAGGPGS